MDEKCRTAEDIMTAIDFALNDISHTCSRAIGESIQCLEESLEDISAKIETIKGLLGEYYESKQ